MDANALPRKAIKRNTIENWYHLFVCHFICFFFVFFFALLIRSFCFRSVWLHFVTRFNQILLYCICVVHTQLYHKKSCGFSHPLPVLMVTIPHLSVRGAYTYHVLFLFDVHLHVVFHKAVCVCSSLCHSSSSSHRRQHQHRHHRRRRRNRHWIA